MRLKVNLLRMLLVDLVLAVFIVFFLRPTRDVATWQFILVIFVAELVTSGVAHFFSRSTLAYVMVQTLFFSAFLALAFVVFLAPASSIGYDSAFLFVFVVESMGMIASFLLVRRT
ncbi:MAG: hypothetical protein OK454_11130 [Thaumarchaeota archaeon]|nr:hypothetical protein [Nitrososphaerota archaeon]